MAFGTVYKEIAQYVPDLVLIREGRKPDLTRIPVVHSQDPLEEIRLRYSPDTIGQYTTDEQTISIVDKIAPHSITDFMLMVTAKDKEVVTFKDCTPASLRELFCLLYGFAKFATESETINSFGLKGGFFRIGINIDKGTQDRGGIQGERFLHPHCICFEDANGSLNSKPLNLYDHKSDVVFNSVDPLTLSGPQIMRDLIFTSGSRFYAGKIKDVFDVMPFDINPTQYKKFPLAIYLRLKNSWESLKDPAMYVALQELEDKMEAVYSLIKSAFTGLNDPYHNIPWERPTLLDKKEIAQNINELEGLSCESKHGLELLSNELRSISPKVMQRLKRMRENWNISSAEQLLTLAGLAYTAVFFSPGKIDQIRDCEGKWQKEAYLAIQPILRRPSGSGGLNFDQDGNIFKIERGNHSPLLSDCEKQIRKNFQTKYTEYVML